MARPNPEAGPGRFPRMMCPKCGSDLPAQSGVCPACGAPRPATGSLPPDAPTLGPGSPAPTGMRTARTPSVGASVGPLTPGQEFGPRYRILKTLGAGGMGAVYQAWDEDLGVAVATRLTQPGLARHRDPPPHGCRASVPSGAARSWRTSPTSVS